MWEGATLVMSADHASVIRVVWGRIGRLSKLVSRA
jgi:hypothetical protein